MRSDSHTTETIHTTSDIDHTVECDEIAIHLPSRPTSLGTGSAALWPQVMLWDIVWALRSCYYEGLTRGVVVLVCRTEKYITTARGAEGDGGVLQTGAISQQDRRNRQTPGLA